MTIILSLLALALPGPPALGLLDGPRVDVRLEIGKTRYVFQEPVDVRLTFINRDVRRVDIQTMYPFFEPLRFESADFVARRESGGGSIRGTSRTIEPGGSWSTKVFLQRHVLTPKPGAHVARVELGVEAYYTDDRPNGPMSKLKAEAEVRFRVEAGRPGELLEALKLYDNAIKAGPDEDEWAYREAGEAIFYVEDPVVIPICFDFLRSSSPEMGTQPIEKFRDRPEVRRALREMARLGAPGSPYWALNRLTDWRDPLPADILRPWLQSSQPYACLGALRHMLDAGAPPDEALRPDVLRLAGVGVPLVAMPALAVQAAWDAKPRAPTPDRLDAAVRDLGLPGAGEPGDVLEAAAAWKYDVGRPRIQSLLATPEAAERNRRVVLRYAEAMKRADYVDMARGDNGAGPAK